MANPVKLLLISATGVPIEHNGATDDVTFLSYSVTSGGPVLDGSGLDLNNLALSDAGSIAFTDPATDGITVTAGTLIADNIMSKNFSNTMAAAGQILFPTVTDDADLLSSLRLPKIAGAPTAAPTAGEASFVWDSTNDKLYVYSGAAWSDQSVSSEAKKIINNYTAGAGGILIRDAVYVSAADTVLKAKATSSANESYCIGLAYAPASAGNPCAVQSAGILGGFTGLSAGARYFLDAATAGVISSSVPSGSGNVVVQVGYAKSTTDLDIQILQLGRRV